MGKSKSARFSVALPISQGEALRKMQEETGLSKNDLVRQGVALLTAMVVAQEKGLDTCFVKDGDIVTRLQVVGLPVHGTKLALG